MQYRFPRTIGQDEAKESLRRALAQGRFPHALLVHGEPGLGQHALLLDMAAVLSCASDHTRPCGDCAPCKAFRNAALESVHYLIPLAKKDKDSAGESERDSEEPPGLGSALIEELAGAIRQWHDRPYGFGVAEKALVRVPQARELLGRLGYAQSGSQPRIVLVPYLEDLNPEAANALLKTLEEPSPGVYFLIASENRAALLPTLLSRCLHLGLGPLAPAAMGEAAKSLAAGADAGAVAKLLPFAEGSPGVLLDLLENGESLLEEGGKFLAAALSSDWRVFADYVSSSEVEGMEETTRLLQFLLRCIRLHHVLRASHPGLADADPGYRWTAEALRGQGWDPALAGTLGPLQEIPDVATFAAYLEEAFRAVKAYCRPQAALLGLFLEYEAKAAPAAAGVGGD
jgi:DNA polymerase-3 subunit delta'